MQILLVLFVMIVGGFVSNIALADEFGDRFYNQAPQGLGEYTMEEEIEIQFISMDDIAKNLQDIMPAAGDEEVASPEIGENISTEE